MSKLISFAVNPIEHKCNLVLNVVCVVILCQLLVNIMVANLNFAHCFLFKWIELHVLSLITIFHSFLLFYY